MKISAILLCFFILSDSVIGNSKVDSTKCNIKISDAYMLAGLYTISDHFTSLNDFRKLAPNSDLLKNDFTGFYGGFNSGFGYSYSSQPILSGGVGIKFRDKANNTYKENRTFHLGLSYYTQYQHSMSLDRQDSKPYDTLTSSQTGQQVYIDSIFYKQYYMTYSTEQLRLEFSLIFNTNSEARWSLFGGGGMTLGISLNPATTISYYESNYVSNSGNNNNYYYYTIQNNTSETFKNKSSFGGSVFIPLGIDYRLGAKKEFWKRLHLFAEIRPELNMNTVPELKEVTTQASIQKGIGLRVHFD